MKKQDRIESANRSMLMAFAVKKVEHKLKDLDLMAYAGLPEPSWYRKKKDPGTFRLSEIRALDSKVHFSDEELIAMIRGR